jgi:hypothetical protein
MMSRGGKNQRRERVRRKKMQVCEKVEKPSGATNHWKNTVFQDFSTFSHTCIFFLLTLSLL